MGCLNTHIHPTLPRLMTQLKKYLSPTPPIKNPGYTIGL
jgi:hypothetical protein